MTGRSRQTARSCPGLDTLVGGTEPADIAVVLDVTQVGDLPARPLWSELEHWRQAGGRVDITRASLAKGASRAAAAGTLSIDELHRPSGEINLSSVGIGGCSAGSSAARPGLRPGCLAPFSALRRSASPRRPKAFPIQHRRRCAPCRR